LQDAADLFEFKGVIRDERFKISMRKGFIFIWFVVK